jgi:hypothetical protein
MGTDVSIELPRFCRQRGERGGAGGCKACVAGTCQLDKSPLYRTMRVVHICCANTQKEVAR